MEVCCICSKPKAFAFSPELKNCVICKRSYHIDCHQPSLESDTPTDFACTSCTRNAGECSFQRPPRKKVRLNPSLTGKRESRGNVPSSHIDSDAFTKTTITKRDAIDYLRKRNPSNQELQKLFDRYINKTASREDRQLVRERIQEVARDLLEAKSKNHTDVSSLLQSGSKSTNRCNTDTTSVSLPQRPVSDHRTPNKLVGSSDIPKDPPIAPREHSLKDSFETRAFSAASNRSAPSTNPTPSQGDSRLQVKIIDLTKDSEDETQEARPHSLSKRLDQGIHHPGLVNSSAVQDLQASPSDYHGDSQHNERSTPSPPQPAPMQAQTHKLPTNEQPTSNRRIKDMWLRIDELERIKQSGYETINELRAETAQLKSQLSVAKQELRSKQPIATMQLPPDNALSTINLPMRNSQGDNPPMVLSPESEHQSPTIAHPTQAQTKDADDHHTQAELFQAKMTMHEQQQMIKRLEQELEAVKSGRKTPMSRIAHTNIVDGTPIGLPQIISGKGSPGPSSLSRKQTMGQINLHRAKERRTKLYVDPIRWIARDQPDQSRPRAEHAGFDGSSDQGQQKAHRNSGVRLPAARPSNRMLNSPATSDSDCSTADETDEVDEHSNGTGSNSTNDISKASSNAREVANSSYEADSSMENEGTQTATASRDTERNDTLSGARRVRTPEAVRAARSFERAFEIEANAMPVVTDSRLGFCTGEISRNSRPRAAQNDVYRVGRDVLGEMR